MNSAFRGIGIRALLLIIGIVVVGIWLATLALKIAGAAIHIVLILGLLLVIAAALSSAFPGNENFRFLGQTASARCGASEVE